MHNMNQDRGYGKRNGGSSGKYKSDRDEQLPLVPVELVYTDNDSAIFKADAYVLSCRREDVSIEREGGDTTLHLLSVDSISFDGMRLKAHEIPEATGWLYNSHWKRYSTRLNDGASITEQLGQLIARLSAALASKFAKVAEAQAAAERAQAARRAKLDTLAGRYKMTLVKDADPLWAAYGASLREVVITGDENLTAEEVEQIGLDKYPGTLSKLERSDDGAWHLHIVG